MKRFLYSCLFAFVLTAAHADPLITSWLTSTSGKYARIYANSVALASGSTSTTWTASGGGGHSQTSPAYCGVQEIYASTSWVYLKNTGLAPYVMGPWQNPNTPSNQLLNVPVYRFPRSPVTSGTSKTSTGNGAIGFLVDGVAIYNTSDSFSYSNANSQDATPQNANTLGTNGDKVWNRDAYYNELVSLDASYNHPQPSGEYHSHANSLGTRYLVGDNVLYSGSTKTYSENTSNTSPNHSPIIGWMKDGVPLYGPYGYDGGGTGATATATLSGSGTVGSVTVGNAGTYTSAPAITFSSGTATAVATMKVITAAPGLGGTGYALNNVLTIVGGSNSVPATVTVTGTGPSGSIVSGSVTAAGNYSIVPPNYVSVTGGSGTGATLLLMWGVNSINVTNGGSGYGSAPNVTIGGVRRMISGYVLRTGSYGTDNVVTASGTVTQRTSLPQWAKEAQNRQVALATSQYGPATTSSGGGLNYAVGHYIEDYDYLGDHGYTQGATTSGTVGTPAQFDLNRYNTRYCITPEYPGGTWAYFTTILANGTPTYPFQASYWYFGSTTISGTAAGSTTTAAITSDGATSQFIGGPNTSLNVNTPTVTSGTVSLTWSAVEGGTYSVDASTSPVFSPFTSEKTGLVSTGTSTATTYSPDVASTGTRYARVNRTALATFDTTGITTGTTQSGTASYTSSGTTSPVLVVTPSIGLTSSGTVGGPFSPSSVAYTLSGSGAGTLNWTASNTQTWLTLSGTSGSFVSGSSVIVTGTINSNANILVSGSYSDTITFTSGSNSITRPVSLTVISSTGLTTPILSSQPTYSPGSSKTISWAAVSGATSYTLQIATNSGFTTNLVSQNITSPTTTVGGTSYYSGTFSNLVEGTTYYYRIQASNGSGSSSYSNVVSSTQDTGAPTIAITTPASSVTQSGTSIVVSGTCSDAISGISSVKINNVTATSNNNFATWSGTVPLGFGSNAITATATDAAGNQATSSAVTVKMTTFQTYNPLIIPDTITGTTFNLALNQTSKFFPTYTTSNPTLGLNSSTALGASATTTMGYNGALMWGPTLIMNQGDAVQINVTNNLNQSSSTLLRETATTVHWHGLHIPAIMDGGPRQVIAGGTTWSPSFTMKNNAATYWYHPHLHIATQEQLTFGAGGFIIVHDLQESTLALPKTYGVDDIPLAVTTRRFLATSNEFSANQYVQSDGSTSSKDNYGDYVLVNGTINPQVSLPQQYVRLRILNADIQRGYRFGFSDNRNFYVIANDQGLLNTPQLVSQVTMMIGERVEILVNLGSDAQGSSLDLMVYNNLGTAGLIPNGTQAGFAGSEHNSTQPNGLVGTENNGLLDNSDFKVLHINVVAPTANPVTSVPATLANNTYWTNTDVTNTRTVNITGGNGGTPGFTFDNIAYSPTVNNYTIPLNAVEKWTITGGNVFGHSLHIHDIKFKIVNRFTTSGSSSSNQIFNTVGGTATLIGSGTCANYESGWKDTVYVPRTESVSVIAKYDDFASSTNPYMFHCHMLDHEDGGLMGQFVVVNNATENLAIASFTRTGSSNYISLQFNATAGTSYNLQYSTDLSNWTTIASVTSNGTSANFLETDATRLAQGKGFYRVVLPSVVTPPVITSSLTATATHGVASSNIYQISATNGASSFSAVTSNSAGLPGGLSVNTNTGVISGTPTAAGTYNISIIASNSGGSTHATLVLTVN